MKPDTELDRAQKAWEAEREANKGPGRAAFAYAFAVMAAHYAGDLTEDEAKTRLTEMKAWARAQLPPAIADLVEQLTDAGLPHGVILSAARHALNGDGEAFQIISVDSNGVATLTEISPEPADGIGRPIGNA